MCGGLVQGRCPAHHQVQVLRCWSLQNLGVWRMAWPDPNVVSGPWHSRFTEVTQSLYGIR
jgi:hypothetical protein